MNESSLEVPSMGEGEAGMECVLPTMVSTKFRSDTVGSAELVLGPPESTAVLCSISG